MSPRRALVLSTAVVACVAIAAQGVGTSSVAPHQLTGIAGDVDDNDVTTLDGEQPKLLVAVDPPAPSTSDPSTTLDMTAEGPIAGTTIAPPPQTVAVEPPPPGDNELSRTVPEAPSETVPAAPPPPWASSVHTTGAGYLSTDLGCANGTSAGALDAFFAARAGPLLGFDYQHVYPLGGKRFLWLMQDSFLDQSGAATRFSQAAFVHNAAMVQDGACFTLLHRGDVAKPASFEPGSGESVLSTWFWPMGGELVGGSLVVFWAEMHKDGGDPGPGDGLGWHPTRTWIATYNAKSLARTGFAPAPNSGVSPIYGYAVASDGQFTYLFGNTFEQNLSREGGFFSGPHSATRMWLARVPAGRLGSAPEYRTADGWTADPTQAVPITQRYWAENPMQPRYLNGQWVATTKVDGYWGGQLAIDVATDPWGPWTTVEVRGLGPRNGDGLMNTYHAHLMPWLDGSGRLVISVSQNARNMLRDAWNNPERYRPMFTVAALVAPPPPTTTTTTTTTTDSTTTTTDSTTTTTEPTTTSSSTTTTTTSSSTTTTSTSTTSTSSTTTTAPGASLPPGTGP